MLPLLNPTHRIDPLVACTTPGAYAFVLIDLLKRAWGSSCIVGSGDNATFSSSGDMITHNGTGAAGANRARAWWSVVAPDGLHAWIIMVTTVTTGTGTTDAAFWITHSKSGPFNDFTSAAGNTPPQLAGAGGFGDNVIGTGATAGYTLLRFGASTLNIAGGASSAAPYFFWTAGYQNAANYLCNHGLSWFPVEQDLFDVTDPDPYLHYAQAGSAVCWNEGFSGAGSVLDGQDDTRGYLPNGAGWSGFNSVVWDVSSWAASGVDPTDGAYIGSPVYFGDVTSDCRKGYSRIFATSSHRVLTNHEGLSMYSDTDGNDRAFIRATDCCLKWNGALGTFPAIGWIDKGDSNPMVILASPPGASTIPPVVDLVSPTVGSEILPTTPVTIDVTDDVTVRRTVVIAKQGDAWDVVHDGESFSPRFASGSTRDEISGGHRYTINRSGGWQRYVPLVIDVHAIDTSGLEDEV